MGAKIMVIERWGMVGANVRPSEHQANAPFAGLHHRPFEFTHERRVLASGNLRRDLGGSTEAADANLPRLARYAGEAPKVSDLTRMQT